MSDLRDVVLIVAGISCVLVMVLLADVAEQLKRIADSLAAIRKG